MKLASIQTISEIRPIDGADRIEAATVLGYQTVIKKGEFRAGDLCVWHEPETQAEAKASARTFNSSFDGRTAQAAACKGWSNSSTGFLWTPN